MPSRLLFVFFLLGAVFRPAAAPAAATDVASESIQRPKGTIHLSADRLEYRREEQAYVAEGSVDIDQPPLHMKADRARLDTAAEKLAAEGNVFFSDGANDIHAERLEVNIDTQLGVIYRARVFVRKEGYHLEGERVERLSDEIYSLDRASFTACDCPEDPAWRFRARYLRLRMDHYITARDVFFDIKGVPVFYLPYFIYPVVTHRQTGLLIPQIGYNTSEGLKLGPVFYWAISKSQDATLSLDYRSLIGIGGNLEYRYVLDRNSRGIFNGTYFRDDNLQQNQMEIRFQHQERFSDHLSATLNVNYVNVQNYYRNLSELTEERGARNVESNFILTYRDSNSYAYLLARYTQDLTVSNNTTLQRLPEIGYSLSNYRLGPTPLYLQFQGVATNFWRESGLKAQRGDFYPSLSLPIPLADGVTLTPQAGVRETVYSRSNVSDRSIHREAYPLGARLAAVASGGGEQWIHRLEPSLTYEYIPVRDVDDIPQFDEIDTIHRTHLVTAAIDNALLRPGKSGEWREAGYLRFTDTYNIDRARSGDPRPFSDLRQEAGFSPVAPLSLQIDAFYNVYDRRYSAVDTDLVVNGYEPLTLSVGHRYAREGTLPQKGDQFDPFSLGERIATPKANYLTEHVVLRSPWGVSLASKAYYDFQRQGFDEIDYGFRYEGQCWSFTLIYLDLKEKNQLSFMITLRGAGSYESGKMANLF
jgi:LPS-assembly protein